MATNALAQALEDLKNLAGKATEFVKSNPTPVGFIAKQTTPALTTLTNMAQNVGKFVNENPSPASYVLTTKELPKTKDLLSFVRSPIVTEGTPFQRAVTTPVLPFVPQVTLGSLFTRKPETYGSLDPGSLYGYISTKPKTPEGLQEIAQDLILQMVAGVKAKPSSVTSRLSPSRGLGQDLARKGFTWDQIIKLTPQEGQKLLQGRAKLDDFYHQTPVTQKINIVDRWLTPEYVLRKIGLNDESKTLRSHWDAYQDALPREIDKIRSWMARVPSKESNEKIFRALDGEKVLLTQQEGQVAQEIKTYLSDWAKKLKIPPIKRIRDYITHIYDLGSVDAEFDEDLAKLIDPKIAKSVYDPFLLKRTGQRLDYVRDTWQALTAYTKRAVRKYNLDPALERLAAKEPQLELSQWKYVKELTDRINMRPTDFDTSIDNLIKSSPLGYRFGQRPTALISRNIRQATYRGTIGLNVSSAIRNLTQGANTYAELGEKWTMKGYLDMARKWSDTELERVGVLRDSFIQDKSLSAYKRAMNLVDKGLFAMFEAAEKINRGAAYYGAKARALSQGMSEQQAIEAAKALIRKTQFTFGSIDTPLALQSDAMKVVAQLQSFSIKQIEYLLGKVHDKEWAGIIRYVGATLAMKELLKKIGIDLTIFPTLGLSPAMQAGQAAGQIVFGDEAGRKEGLKNLQKTAWTVFPAGVQLKKTIEGSQTFNKGESTAPSGVMRFPIEQSSSNLLRSILFGQYATPEARKYFDTNTKPLSEKQSKTVRTSSDPMATYQTILDQRALNAAKKAQKKILYDVRNGTISIDEGTRRLTELRKSIQNVPLPLAKSVAVSKSPIIKAQTISPLKTYRSGGYAGKTSKVKFPTIKVSKIKLPKVKAISLSKIKIRPLALSTNTKRTAIPKVKLIKIKKTNFEKVNKTLQQALASRFNIHKA
jgi:hypothetical protein